ncbi:MAG: hypothetical protein HKO79_02245 [Desulfobacterales bacterium]|nr:hypothetical protein [Deltaproteobacteria bacterium]NNL41291.1 hypothetical protein [Desulfobacterales bacterium]
MSRNIFFVSAALSLFFIGLSQIPDPGILGIDEEPERIMFYGGSGLFAGLLGLVALVSGTYLCMTRFRGVSRVQRRLILAIMVMVLLAVILTIVIRFNIA